MFQFGITMLIILALVAAFTFKLVRGGHVSMNSMFGGAALTPVPHFNVGERVLYPDKHGHYQRRGRVVSVVGEVAHLRCGHENNSTFPRPLSALRRSAFKSITA